jgi:hypothetical protein
VVHTRWTVLHEDADVKILIVVMVFFALLAVLLIPDGCYSSGPLDSGLFPVPVP